jgi:hypothetical protein
MASPDPNGHQDLGSYADTLLRRAREAAATATAAVPTKTSRAAGRMLSAIVPRVFVGIFSIPPGSMIGF